MIAAAIALVLSPCCHVALTFRWVSAAGGQYPLFVPKPEDADRVAQWEALAAKHGVSLPAVAIAFGAAWNPCFAACASSLPWQLVVFIRIVREFDWKLRRVFPAGALPRCVSKVVMGVRSTDGLAMNMVVRVFQVFKFNLRTCMAAPFLRSIRQKEKSLTARIELVNLMDKGRVHDQHSN